jgi:hypothetical protein
MTPRYVLLADSPDVERPLALGVIVDTESGRRVRPSEVVVMLNELENAWVRAGGIAEAVGRPGSKHARPEPA